MSLKLSAASMHASQARQLSASRSAVASVVTRASPAYFVAVPPQCTRPHAPALRTRPQLQHGWELCKRRQQRASLLQCAAEASGSSSGGPQDSVQDAACPPALVLSSSDDDRMPVEATSTAAGSALDSSSESESGSESGGGSDGAVKIDLQLPRRSLLVQFTCNVCGGRSERLCNPVAWQKGLVSMACLPACLPASQPATCCCWRWRF